MRRKVSFTAGLIAMLALAGPATGQFEKRPGSGQSLEAPHPAYTIEQARPDDFKPQTGALAFLPDGKLAVAAFPPQNNGVFRDNYNGVLYIIDNPTEKDPSKIKVTQITDELHDPLGMAYVDGALYVADRNEVSKWTDTDDDGYPDKRETFASGWVSDNYHHFTFGLPYDGEHFYLTLSTNITFSKMIKEENIQGPIHSLNGPNPAQRGCLLKIDAKTGEYTVVAGGLRTPNGVSMGPDGNVIIPDNQGAWKPASGIYFGKQGEFYGHYNNTEATSDFYPDGGVPSAFSDQPITMPAVWIPQNECANSPGNMVEIPEGNPHAGQYLMAEITRGGIRRVQFEEVDGTWQGAIYRHSHGFEAGTNRLAWGPDGALYVGCMGARGNWSWKGKQTGLQRLAPTGETAFEFSEVNVTNDGFEVSFTEAVDKAQLEDKSNWAVNAWTYKKTRNYGGPKIPKDAKEQVVEIESITASDDGMSVEIVLAEDRKTNHVYHIRSNVTSKDGDKMWSNEVWYTFHKAPAE
jgi:glucose/arabinose dehydrogenase